MAFSTAGVSAALAQAFRTAALFTPPDEATQYTDQVI